MHESPVGPQQLLLIKQSLAHITLIHHLPGMLALVQLQVATLDKFSVTNIARVVATNVRAEFFFAGESSCACVARVFDRVGFHVLFQSLLGDKLSAKFAWGFLVHAAWSYLVYFTHVGVVQMLLVKLKEIITIVSYSE